MTRHRLSDVERVALTVACPLCAVPVQRWCVTIWSRRPGRPASTLHRERADLAATDGTLPITIPGGA